MVHVLAVIGLGAACAGWAALRLVRWRHGPHCGDCDQDGSCPVDRLMRR